MPYGAHRLPVARALPRVLSLILAMKPMVSCNTVEHQQRQQRVPRTSARHHPSAGSWDKPWRAPASVGRSSGSRRWRRWRRRATGCAAQCNRRRSACVMRCAHDAAPPCSHRPLQRLRRSWVSATSTCVHMARLRRAAQQEHVCPLDIWAAVQLEGGVRAPHAHSVEWALWVPVASQCSTGGAPVRFAWYRWPDVLRMLRCCVAPGPGVSLAVTLGSATLGRTATAVRRDLVLTCTEPGVTLRRTVPRYTSALTSPATFRAAVRPPVGVGGKT